MKLIPSCLCLLLFFHCNAQDRSMPACWKKTVLRKALRMANDSGINADGRPASSLLMTKLITAARTGNVPAVQKWATLSEQTKILTPGQLDSILNNVTDRSSVRTIPPDSTSLFSTIEDWAFDPEAGIITGQLKYLGPATCIYSNGRQWTPAWPLFWVAYPEASAMAAPGSLHAIGDALIRGYFQRDTAADEKIHTTDNLLKATVVANINMLDMVDTADTYMATGLVNLSADTPLSKLMVAAMQHHQLQGWTTTGKAFSQPLTDSTLAAVIATRYDTIILEDPVTGKEMTRAVANKFRYSDMMSYRILEKWTVDAATGQIRVKIAGVALVAPDWNNCGCDKQPESLFWVKYTDLQPVLAVYEQYHPGNILPLRIWNQLFYGNKKAQLIK